MCSISSSSLGLTQDFITEPRPLRNMFYQRNKCSLHIHDWNGENYMKWVLLSSGLKSNRFTGCNTCMKLTVEFRRNNDATALWSQCRLKPPAFRQSGHPLHINMSTLPCSFGCQQIQLAVKPMLAEPLPLTKKVGQMKFAISKSQFHNFSPQVKQKKVDGDIWQHKVLSCSN